MKHSRPIASHARPLALLVCAVSIFFSSVSNKSSAADLTKAPATTNVSSQTSGEVLELLDGSTLHGRLRSIDAKTGVSWESPQAKRPFEITPDNIAAIRFLHPDKSPVRRSDPIAQFRLANGDEFFGNLISLSETEAEVQTTFGGKFKTPRSTLSSIRFFSKGAAPIFEGPTGLDGWTLGKAQSTNTWIYRDGAFIANSSGTIGRDLNLPTASRLQFDLAWTAPFNLLFSFYTGAFDGFNYNNSCYMFYITLGNISLQRINAGAGSSTMGRTETIGEMLTKKNAHLEFRANKADGTLEILVDGRLANRWKDTAGWVGSGSGILFYAQNDSAITLSNLKVSEWDGRPGDEGTTNAPSNVDQIFLANSDSVSGKLASIAAGTVKFTSSSAALEIPLPRVTQVLFSGAKTNSAPRNSWEVQVALAGGGTISFDLENWGPEKIVGQNKHFGKISLNSPSVRLMKFNADKRKTPPGQLGSPEDIIWEAREE